MTTGRINQVANIKP